MADAGKIWDSNKLSYHSLRKYECFFHLNVDYNNENAYEILRSKVDEHFKKELKVDHKLAVEKLLKMRKDDRVDEAGIMKSRKSTRNKEKVVGDPKQV